MADSEAVKLRALAVALVDVLERVYESIPLWEHPTVKSQIVEAVRAAREVLD